MYFLGWDGVDNFQVKLSHLHRISMRQESLDVREHDDNDDVSNIVCVIFYMACAKSWFFSSTFSSSKLTHSGVRNQWKTLCTPHKLLFQKYFKVHHHLQQSHKHHSAFTKKDLWETVRLGLTIISLFIYYLTHTSTSCIFFLETFRSRQQFFFSLFRWYANRAR